MQVTKALEAAHEQGMIHRDIKPDNLFLTKQGVVKLMDFGLAKPLEEEGGGAPQSSVTGTSGYMSPEQKRGEALDARSDIYSLGKVLEELAGSSPPRRLAPILRKALTEDPEKRWQSASELRGALEAAGRRKKLPRVALVTTLAVAMLAVAGLVVWLRVQNKGESLRPVPLVALGGWAMMPAFSPDGNRVAFDYESASHGADEKGGIYVKQVGGGPAVRLTNGWQDDHPAWSPDDRNIAFLRGAGKDRAVMLIPAIGGTAREVAKVDASGSRMSWTPDSRWLVLSARASADEPYGIWLFSPETGERRRLIYPPNNLPRRTDWVYGDTACSLSPDGRVLVFARTLGTYNFGLYRVWLTPDLRPEGPPQKVTEQTYIMLADMDWVGQREIVFSDGGFAEYGSPANPPLD